MRLTSAHLVNFGPYTDFKVSFGEGLIAIMGPNGSGKSTLLDGIYSTLTNDFGRFAGVKQDNIRATAPADAPAFAEIRLEHNRHEYRLRRNLRAGPAGHKLTLPGGKTLVKDVEIREYLETQLGLARRLIDNYLFVGQWEMFAFLDASPAVRSDSFQNLCGVDRAAKIYDALSKQRLRDEALIDSGVVDALDRQRVEFVEATAASQKARSDLAAARSGRLPKQEVAAIVGKLRSFTLRRRSAARLKRCLPRLRESVAAFRVQAAAAAQADDIARKTASLVQLLSEEVSEARQQLAAHAQRTERAWQLQAAEGALGQARKCLEASPAVSAEAVAAANAKLAELSDTCSQLQAERKMLSAVIDGMIVNSSDETCPTCGGSLAEAGARLAERRLQRTAISEQLAKAEKALGKARQHASSLQAQAAEHSAVVSSVQRSTAELARCRQLLADAPKVSGDPAAWETTMADYEDAQQQNTEAARKHSAAVAAVTTARREVRRLRKVRLRLRAVLAKNPRVSTSAVTTLKQSLAKHREAKTAVRLLQALKAEANKRLVAVGKELDRLEALQRRSENAVEWLGHIDKLQKIFHRDSAPRVVIRSYLRLLEDEINRVLEMLEAPFKTTSDDSLSFVVHFPGEPPRSASRLSGGQKVILSLAFRLAVHSLFASEVSMMVLDEPTAGLDERNIECLERALTLFGKQALTASLQVIMVTHDRRLAQAFDQVINITPQGL